MANAHMARIGRETPGGSYWAAFAQARSGPYVLRCFGMFYLLGKVLKETHLITM